MLITRSVERDSAGPIPFPLQRRQSDPNALKDGRRRDTLRRKDFFQTMSNVRTNNVNKANKVNKRITMNPPEEFVAFAAALNPQIEQVNNPIVIGQGGQAVMIPPESISVPTTVETTPEVKESPVTYTLPSTLSESVPTQVVSTTIPPTTEASATTAPSETVAPSTQAVTTPSPTTQVETSTAVTSETIMTTVSSSASETSAVTSTQPTSVHTSITLQTSSIPSSTASIAAANTAHPFTHSAPFIFLCVLGSLVIVAVLATSLSWVFRRPCLPCCNKYIDDDDDGLSDLVTSFHSHTPSRSSTIRRSGMYDDDAESALHHRATAFASDPTQSPFLHSGTAGIWNVPVVLAGAPSIQVPAPAHLYGATGPLEIRNAVPGEMEGGEEDHGTPEENLAIGSPRFLGVEGDGLDVPWSRQSSSNGLIGLGLEPNDSSLTLPYMSAPDARDYLGAPAFASPQMTVEELGHFQTIPDEGSPPPQRAGTWASNLRNTLFAAIAGNKAREEEEEEDRYTRSVLPLHRNSTRRKGFPVVEEKDEFTIPETHGSTFLTPSYSSSSSGSTIAPTMSKKLPLRGGAAERYKRYYARSTASSSGSESSWNVDDRIPSRLAGGERAKGVKGN